MRYLLDTNIIIYLLRNNNQSIKNHLKDISFFAIGIPSIVTAEIEYGARKSSDYQKTISLYREFIDLFHKVHFSDKAARHYGKIRAELEKNGEIIGPNDLMIASIALAEDCVLITHNTKEFKRVPNLRVEDWCE